MGSSDRAADPLADLLDLPGVRVAVAEARTAVDGQLAHWVLRRGSAAVNVESALRGARASAALEGADHPLPLVRAGEGGPVVRGALRVSAQIGALTGTWRLAPGQVLARLHALAAAELVPAELLGRPAAGSDVGHRLTALSQAVSASPTAVPAVLVAAVVHGELLALTPFVAANGIVARAASRLTLITRGLDPKSVSVPEVGHFELAASYADSARGYATGGPDAVATWLRHCCAAVAIGAREGLAICEAVARG